MWEIAVRCDCHVSSIQRWRTRKGLPPNGEKHLPGFLSEKDKYERPVPQPVELRKEAGIMVKGSLKNNLNIRYSSPFAV
jgi:hypothetical protein